MGGGKKRRLPEESLNTLPSELRTQGDDSTKLNSPNCGFPYLLLARCDSAKSSEVPGPTPSLGTSEIGMIHPVLSVGSSAYELRHIRKFRENAISSCNLV
ncbi:hypothetical protein ASPCAL13151 [Aspergillus calidoustus]|uniref:Uncharacterized protein n=1 Tax=Aspergillus calidoustus TaxID=454130 RepID=A0A0U5GGR1_ASPCI|nr:hypothetical protein ASPCAL13151 [Aspergillus calidoustus]